MFPGSVLLERGGQGDGGHHCHGLPLLGLLADVDRDRREGLKSRLEAGVTVALLALFLRGRHVQD